MDLADYTARIIEPTISDFEADPTSVRHAFLSCVAVFHMIDYLAFTKHSAGIRTKFRSKSAEFAIVDQVAHAIKHVKAPDIKNPVIPSVTYEEVIPRPPCFFGVGYFDLSRFGDTVGGVTLDYARNIDLLSVIKKAAQCIRDHANTYHSS